LPARSKRLPWVIWARRQDSSLFEARDVRFMALNPDSLFLVRDRRLHISCFSI
jgi:hypothetical protein